MVGTRVYLGGLSYRVGERDIDKFFKQYSGVGDIVIKNGFAFVEFEDHREADDAIYEMNGKELLGGRVTVEKAKGTPRTSRWVGGRSGGAGRMSGMQRRIPPAQRNSRYGMPSRTKYRLTVMNLSSKVSWQDLKDFMRQAGEVTYADAHKHRKNEGVIEFATHSDMRNAMIKLDGKDLRGRRIKLYDESGQGSSSKRRSRSRSHSRSRSRSPLSRSKSRSASRSRSRTPNNKARSRSRTPSKSRSHTPQRSKSRSASRGRSNERRNNRSRSDSRSPVRDRRSSEDKD